MEYLETAFIMETTGYFKQKHAIVTKSGGKTISWVRKLVSVYIKSNIYD